jgi:FKBP-type peptidyl-prolyl cis-trans isomerase
MKGIRIKSEIRGTGELAIKADRVVVAYTLALNGGDVVREEARACFGLDDRNVIAGLRNGIVGMRVGGCRVFSISPHLAYGSEGVSGSQPPIPPNAVLVCDVRLISAVHCES